MDIQIQTVGYRRFDGFMDVQIQPVGYRRFDGFIDIQIQPDGLRRLDGFMDGWLVKQKEAQMTDQIYMVGWFNGQIDRRLEGWMFKWMNGLMVRWIDVQVDR